MLDLYTAMMAKPKLANPARVYRDSGRDYSRRSGFPCAMKRSEPMLVSPSITLIT